MLLAMLIAAAEEAPELGPYVGGGVGVGALMFVVHRVSVAIDRMTRAVQVELRAWNEHRDDEVKWWADMRKAMDRLAELDRKGEAEAAGRYAAEVRALRVELGRLHQQFKRLRKGGCDAVALHRKSS